MPVPFSPDDLGRLFEARALTRGRSLGLIGAVQVGLAGDVIKAVVEDKGVRHVVGITPDRLGDRTVFSSECTCRVAGCVHRAAAALAALDRFPELRRQERQKTMFDRLAEPATERQRLVIDLAPAEPPHASPPHSCIVAFTLVGQQSGAATPATPRRVLADPTRSEDARAIARLAMPADASRVGIGPAQAPQLLGRLARSGLGRWAPTGRRLIVGGERILAPDETPPEHLALILSETGPWYVDTLSGAVGSIRARAVARPAAARLPASGARARPGVTRPAARARPSGLAPVASERVIVEHVPIPVLRLRRLDTTDEAGRPQTIDALAVDFDYGGTLTHADDDRQFLRIDGPGGPSFCRRDPAAETAALEVLQPDGFVQMRVAEPGSARGRRVLVFHGREAGASWQHFMAVRLPALTGLGWQNEIDGAVHARKVDRVGAFDVRVSDGAGAVTHHGGLAGAFSLDFGIEIEGVRRPLLPILTHLIERGGIDAARIDGDELITSLDDGRAIRLPAEQMRRLLSILGDLIETATPQDGGALLVPAAEASAMLDLEELLVTRWDQDAAAIRAYVAQFRADADIPRVAIPGGFSAALRPYQQEGVDWLQHLRTHGLAGFLADDMGLGKTAQTIAHIVTEQSAGRLDRPVLIVVPTSLVPNWTAELKKFAPGLAVAVLHGLDRHERRRRLAGIEVVITTYSVLARDAEEMRGMEWHLVVLDEAQAIKSPDAKATRAACQLVARQRICLSGTPIENNLEELWSQFAFLMPGLLGGRRDFSRRFRTPIEKRADDVRRGQLIRRIRPFILRRTKSEVATELPPKHIILRRITLAPEQRELYETIRASLHEHVRETIAARSLAQSRIVVLDALLKLRQACCDPRLVKLPSARAVTASSKLDDLVEMVREMVAEGRRLLVFSQFTSMLDLIAPRLAADGITFVQLRGDTRDRAEPVRAFEAGEVPVFLISLKAGGRGLNLTSADTVIHYDPWWNPAVEDQATDRAHRIGQTKSVFVFKLIAAGTVEERILELQERKAELANIAFAEEAEIAQLGFDDVDFLFGAEPAQEAA